MTKHQDPRRRDAGLSLVELLVALGLAVLVLSMVGGFMISALTTQQRVRAAADATSRAQLLTLQLDAQLRKASMIRVIDGAATASQLLVARIESGDEAQRPRWRCQAWFYDDDAGVVFHTEYTNATTAPWETDVTAWIDAGTGLADVVEFGDIPDDLDWLVGGATGSTATWAPMASRIRGASGGSAAGEPVFSSTGGRGVTARFAVTTGEAAPIVLTTTVTGRLPFKTEDPACL